MTNLKHTLAPWTMGNENNQCCDVVLGIEHNLTCSIDRQDANTGDFVITRDEMLANAHLISAAPELLEALKDLYGQVMQAKKGFGIYDSSPSMDKAIHTTEAAIAKATGEQP
jgi:hypothetical protein